MKHIKNILIILLILILLSFRPFGDINGDYRVSVTDLVIMHRIVLEMESTPLQRLRADLNRDGIVNDLDMTILHTFIANK